MNEAQELVSMLCWIMTDKADQGCNVMTVSMPCTTYQTSTLYTSRRIHLAL